LFTRRNQDGLVRHSGLLCLDIDFQDNRHIENFADLKQQLQNIQNLAYIGLSVSGNGYYCLVPIAQPQEHKSHFRAICEDLLRFGVVVDKSGSDITRLRFYSHDSQAHFNHEARPYTKLYTEPPPRIASRHNTNTTTLTPLDTCVNMIRKARDGEKHHVLFRAARLAGGYIAGGEATEEAAVRALEEAIRAKPNVTSIRDAMKTIQDGITAGKNSPLKTITENVNNIESVKSVKVSNGVTETTKQAESIELPETYYQKTTKPLQRATGRLAELEDRFVKAPPPPGSRTELVKLFDRYKREPPTPEQLQELTCLLKTIVY
jgi:hypothetical protein